MNVLILKGASQNGVLTLMGERLSSGLNAIGVSTSLLAVEPCNTQPHLRDAVESGVFDAVFSYASFGAEAVGSDGRPLYDKLKHGFIGWNVDHPSYQFARMTAPVARRLTICASNDHFQFMNFMGARGRSLPLLPGVYLSDRLKPWGERPIDLLVAMSWMGRPDRWWAGSKGTPIYDLLESVLERLSADPELNLLKAYKGAVKAAGIRVPLGAELSNMIGMMLTYVRQMDRLRLVESLAAANINFTLCGDGWQEMLGPNPRITFLPSLDFARLNELYGECKVVLNVNAANGGSERAMAAMAAGAAVLSDHSALLESEFKTQVTFFNRADPASAALKFEELMQSGRGEAVAEQCYTSVSAKHLWEHKAQQINRVLLKHS